MQSRRDFLKLLGMAMGASLSGCGGSGNDGTFSGSANPTPLAYRYVKLIKSGDPLPGGARLAPRVAYSLTSTGDSPPPFMGAVTLTDSRHVYFHALDENQTRGIYRIDVDANGSRSEVKEVIREGSVLPDGTVVKDFSDGDVNNGDDFVLVVENPEGTYSIQYAAGGASFSTIARSGDTLGNVKLAEDIDQYQAVADDGNIIFVAEFMDDAGDCQGEGLFVMPAGRPEQAQRLLAKGDLLPGTTSVIESFGATEITNDGIYLAQGSGRPAAGSDPSGQPQTFLLRGRIGETPELLTLYRGLGTTTQTLQASAFMCPRLSSAGTGFVLQITGNPDQTQMWFTGPGAPRTSRRLLLTADISGGSGARTQRSPRGARILSFLPPVFGPNGLLYFEVFTDEGMEIVLWDGANFQTILARGDVIDGKRVETIIFGSLPDCVNANGDFAAIVEFDDGETDVYLGMPV
jgi:hypothetical protein